jgi:hypothetical protein
MIEQLRIRITRVVEQMNESTNDLRCTIDTVSGSLPVLTEVRPDAPKVRDEATLTAAVASLENALDAYRNQMKRLWSEESDKVGRLGR